MTAIYVTEKRYDDALAVMDEMIVHLPGWKDKIKQNRLIIEQEKSEINNINSKQNN